MQCLPQAYASFRAPSVIEEMLAATDKTEPQSLRLGTSCTLDGYLLGASGRTVESVDRLRKAIALLELLEHPAGSESRSHPP